jgi:hypothetical protein
MDRIIFGMSMETRQQVISRMQRELDAEIGWALELAFVERNKAPLKVRRMGALARVANKHNATQTKGEYDVMRILAQRAYWKLAYQYALDAKHGHNIDEEDYS